MIGGIVILVWGFKGLKEHGRKESKHIRETEEEDDSLEILKKRYAKGEISQEEFEQKKKDLEKCKIHSYQIVEIRNYHYI